MHMCGVEVFAMTDDALISRVHVHRRVGGLELREALG
jgi:hypothetical protein